MNPNDVTIGLAVLAGLASFLSPCVLALVPAYVGYLGGRSISSSGTFVENRWTTFSHGVAFVLGFSVVFISLGAAASAIGILLFDLREWLARIGGIVVIIFGLHTMGVINIPFLNYDTRRQSRPAESLSYASSFMMGVFFSAGWAPCVGPVLGAVLTLAITSSQPFLGVVLLSAYSVGLAIPFLFAALGVGRVSELLRTHTKAIRTLSIITGAFLVVIGVLLLFGLYEQIMARLNFFFIDFGI
jgi:cytochrome c-type biogenesis protein